MSNTKLSKLTRRAMTAILGIVMSVGAAQVADASHRGPIRLLKATYANQRDVLLADYRAQREEVECAKRDAIAALKIQKHAALRLHCPRERVAALAQLGFEKRAVMTRYRSDLISVRTAYELRSKQLRLAYEQQLAVLRLRPVTTEVTIIETQLPRTCGTPVPGIPTPAFPTPALPVTPYSHTHEHVHRPQVEQSWQHGELYEPEVIRPDTNSELIIPEVYQPEVIEPAQPLFKLQETNWSTSTSHQTKTMTFKLGRLGTFHFGI